MVEIEFLNPEPDGPQAPPARPDEVPPRARDWVTAGRWVGPVLWAAAAVLVLTAPFRMLYRLTVHAFAEREIEQFDGWGRIRQPLAGFAEHGPRYGVLLCVVAGVFLIVAGVSALHLLSASETVRRRLALRPIAAGAGMAGLGLLVGTIGAALINVQSVSNNIDAQLAAPSDDESVVNSPANPSAQIDLGGTVWLSLAAFVLAVTALAITAAQARRVAGAVVVAPVRNQPQETAVPVPVPAPAPDEAPLPLDTALDSSLQPIAPPYVDPFVSNDSDDDTLH